MPDRWIDIVRAFEIACERLPGSIGQNKEALLGVLERGDVRSIWAEHFEKAKPVIPKTDWRDADIDLYTGRILLANGNGRRGVQIEEGDLLAWLNAPAPLPPSGTRFPEDALLVAEGRDGIPGKWSNAHQAALALWPKARGASQTAKIRRLEGKIRKHLTFEDHPRNSSKQRQ